LELSAQIRHLRNARSDSQLKYPRNIKSVLGEMSAQIRHLRNASRDQILGDISPDRFIRSAFWEISAQIRSQKMPDQILVEINRNYQISFLGNISTDPMHLLRSELSVRLIGISAQIRELSVQIS